MHMKKYLTILAALALVCSCNDYSAEEAAFWEQYYSEWNYESAPGYLSEHNIWRPADSANTMIWNLGGQNSAGEFEWVQGGPEMKHVGSSYEFTMPVTTGSKVENACLTIKPDVDIVTDANKRYECIFTYTASKYNSDKQSYIHTKFYSIPNQDGQPMGWVFGSGFTEPMPNGKMPISRGGAEITPVYSKPLLLQLSFTDILAGTVIKIKDITIREFRYWNEE